MLKQSHTSKPHRCSPRCIPRRCKAKSCTRPIRGLLTNCPSQPTQPHQYTSCTAQHRLCSINTPLTHFVSRLGPSWRVHCAPPLLLSELWRFSSSPLPLADSSSSYMRSAVHRSRLQST